MSSPSNNDPISKPRPIEAPPATTEIEVSKPFRGLRATTQRRMCIELADRIATNPAPTPLEEAMGVYVESLEPQIRSAVVTLRTKGWDTNSSGFGGPKHSQLQVLQFSGDMFLDKVVQQAVEADGAELYQIYPHRARYELSFEPELPDIDTITDTWDRIAGHIPDLGQPITSQRSRHWTDRAFVINALNIGLCADQLVGSPFATEHAIEEAMSGYGFNSRQEHRPLV